MLQLTEFIQENIWLCIGVGVVLIIVGDELFGVTKSLFGDDADDYGFSRSARLREEKMAEQAEEDFPEADDTVSVEDLLTPKNRK